MRLLYGVTLLTIHRRQYIEMFSMHRRRDPCGDDNDILRDIDDVRNGLFLTACLHRVLGISLAFLKVNLFDLMLHMVRS